MLYGLTKKINKHRWVLKVLILIFLENALRLDGELISDDVKRKVLILIFLENALRLWIRLL